MTKNFSNILAVMLVLLLAVSSMSVLNFSSVEAMPGTTIYIMSDGSVDPPTAPIQRLGNVYTFTNDITYPEYEGIVVQKNEITIDGNGYTLQGSGEGGTNGFRLAYNNKVTIKNTNIRNFGRGIFLDSSHTITIGGQYSGNTITNNAYGIFLVGDSDGNQIPYNEMTSNGQGVYLIGVGTARPDFNIICNNTMIGNTDSAVYLEEGSGNDIHSNDMSYNGIGGFCAVWLCEADGNTVSGNFLEYNGVGVGLQSSDNNEIFGNRIYTGECGIALNDLGSSGTESQYNTVYENLVRENSFGVYLTSSSGNEFFHNNFIDNTQQVYITESGYANVWDDDYPSGGNYWSDYAGTDANSDGIGDTPYVIETTYNQDNYPLIGLYYSFNLGTLGGLPCILKAISNSTEVETLGFDSDDHELKLLTTGETGTSGKATIAIPISLMWCDDWTEWIVLVDGSPVEYTVVEGPYTFITFEYSHSTETIQIFSTYANPLDVYDCSVIDVSPSDTVVNKGNIVYINVIVENQGDFLETFGLVAPYFDGEVSPTPHQWEIFWSMGDCNNDGFINQTDYDIIGENWLWVGPPGENPADINSDGYVDLLDALICASNAGLDIWMCFGLPMPPVGTQRGVRLKPGYQATLTFTWNTTNVALGTYVISAYAIPIPYEIDIIDNTYVDGEVEVILLGDINGDCVVDIQDATQIGLYWLQLVPPAPANVDINDDGVIDISDATLVGLNWLKSA